jgi:CubicO group peptidase (beta-lactamase class C family)
VEPASPITVRHLVTSTGGIAGFGSVAGGAANEAGIEVQRLYSEADLTSGDVRRLSRGVAALPLASHPGARFQYGLSHDVQGALIEAITGVPLDRFLREQIFEPLGMPDTGFMVPSSERERLVQLAEYGPDGTLTASSARLYLSDDGAHGRMPALRSLSGGLYGTLTDYSRFLRMLANGGELDHVRVLAPSSVALMTSNLLPPGVSVEFQERWVGHGYGVNVGIVEQPLVATMWAGPVGAGTWFWSGAHGSWFWVDPVHDLIVTGFVQHAFSGQAHMGRPHPAPDVRALSRSLVYQALTHPER